MEHEATKQRPYKVVFGIPPRKETKTTPNKKHDQHSRKKKKNVKMLMQNLQPNVLVIHYQVNKGDKDNSTGKSKKHTKEIQEQNENKQTQYYFIPSRQLCQNKN